MQYLATCLCVLGLLVGTHAQPLSSDSLSNGLYWQDPASILSPVWHWEDSSLNEGLLHDPWELLRGRVPGLLISRAGQDPNEAPDVRLRGVSSLISHGSPLVVVDGMPHIPLQSVDPHDIASMTFFSGAQALTLYGAQGAGGVLVVRTKRPEQGRPLQVGYQGQGAVSGVSTYWPVLSGSEYLARVDAPDLGSETDWQREITRRGIDQAHSLSLSGATDVGFQYRAALHYRQAQGVLQGQGFTQLSGRVHLQQAWLQDRLRIQAHVQRWQRNADIGRPQAIRYAMTFNPTAPVFSEDPTTSDITGYFQQELFAAINPVWMINETFVQSSTRQTSAQVRGSFDWLPGLTTEVDYMTQWVRGEVGDYQPQPFVQPNFSSLLSLGEVADSTQVLRATTRYRYNGENMGVHALIGVQQVRGDVQSEGLSLFFMDPTLIPTDLQNILDQKSTYEGLTNNLLFQDVSREGWVLTSGFLQVDWNLRRMLYLSGVLRREQSMGGLSGWYPNVSAALRLDQLGGLAESGLDLARIRMSVGQSGYFSRLSGAQQPFFSPFQVAYISPEDRLEGIPDPTDGLRPDLVQTVDLGIDLQMSHWFATLNFYQRTTHAPWRLVRFDSLPGGINSAIPFASPDLRIRNRGIEVQLGLRLGKGNTRYQATLNLASYQNRVLYREEAGATRPAGADFDQQFISSAPGTPGFGSTITTRVAVDGFIGELYGPLLDERATRSQEELVLVDADGDEFTEDFTTLGNGLPNWSLGLHQQWQFGPWRIAALLRGDLGHDLLNFSRLHYEPLGVFTQSNRIQTEAFDPLPTFPAWHDFYVERASYMVLDFLSLSYELFQNKDWSLSVSLTGRNLFWLTNYSGIDPSPRLKDLGLTVSEYGAGSFGPDYTSLGLDRRSGMYPTRSLMAGVAVRL